MTRNFYNDKGQTPDPTLEPADLEQCQCQPNMLSWSPFAFGPMPTPVRCTNKPVAVLVENKPARVDARIGSMSLCEECLPKHQKHFPPTHAKVNMIGGAT